MKPRKPGKYILFSLCCVLVRNFSGCLAGILSPQRLPFRHPGTGSMEKVACMGAALNVGGEGGEAGASIGG
ncbi:MAG: hypothetical protein WBF09_15115, partial [Candidatus Acidiferrum sp.]